MELHIFLASYFIDLEYTSRVFWTGAPTTSSPAPLSARSDADGECTTPDTAAQDAWCLKYFTSETIGTLLEGKHVQCILRDHTLITKM